MEYALPELLTRNEILRILHERCLHVNNIEMLPLDELHCIYKRYILPRARREQLRNRTTNTAAHTQLLTTTTTTIEDKTKLADRIENKITPQLKRNANIDNETAMDIDMDIAAQKRIKLIYMDIHVDNDNSAPCDKRPLADMLACNTTDNYLSSVTKRIRIDCALSN